MYTTDPLRALYDDVINGRDGRGAAAAGRAEREYIYTTHITRVVLLRLDVVTAEFAHEKQWKPRWIRKRVFILQSSYKYMEKRIVIIIRFGVQIN